MHRIFTVLIYLLFLPSGYGSEASTLPAKSPDGTLIVRVGEDPQRGLVYEVFSVAASKVLVKLRSSYQPEEPDDPSKQWTDQAEVHWSSDSTMVAIDEHNHNYIGTVLVALVTSAETAERVELPVRKLKIASGERWDRVRLYVSTGWEEQGVLGVELRGKAFANKIKGDEHIPGMVIDGQKLPGIVSYGGKLRVVRRFEVISLQ